jgi:hypothetical protein
MSDDNSTRRGALRMFAKFGVAAIIPTEAMASAIVDHDPIFAAIAKHAGLFAWANEPGTTEEETRRRTIVEDEELFKLAETEPTTIAGCVALLEYMSVYDNACLGTADVLPNCAETVANALRKVVENANV